MISEILSRNIYDKISAKFDIDDVYEVRLNAGANIRVNFRSIWHEIGYEVSHQDIQEILYILTRGSIYTYLDQLKRGYVYYKNAIRVGVAGEILYENNKIVSIKNINSLIIRVPHYVVGCCDELIRYIENKDRLLNTVILAPPFCGKTTKLRQLAYFLSKRHNIVIIDEKYELTTYSSKDFCLKNTTNILGVNRSQGVEMALRNLSPDVIVTDEIYGDDDHKAISRAIDSGVCVITSAHSLRENDFSQFDLKVRLAKKPIGSIEKIIMRQL